ncbi:hypothetical protein Bca4012_040452 [Brassica carinata]
MDGVQETVTRSCPPELHGAGRSRRSLSGVAARCLARLRRRESDFRIVGIIRSNFPFSDLDENLADDGAWRRIEVSSNLFLPPSTYAPYFGVRFGDGDPGKKELRSNNKHLQCCGS